MMMNEELLRQIPFFRDLPHGELKFLANTLTVMDIPAGAVLFREGDIGDSFYIVIEGSLDILLGEGTAEEKLFSTVGSGSYLGEMSLLMPGGKRSASARAVERSKLWVMTREDFDDLLHRQPHLGYAMVQVLSERLDASNIATFRDMVAKNRELQKAYDELKDAQEQIIEKEKLEKELELAATIQASILPYRLPRLASHDFGAHIDSARAVGGDFYDVFMLDQRHVGILIGDVADKGVPSAIFMARVHALITAEAVHCDDPVSVLQQVNHYLTKRDESDLFVTCIYGILDIQTSIFHFARAGHEIPLLIAPNSPTSPIQRQAGLPIGVTPRILLDEQSIYLPPDSTLLLFSDGMIDCRNPLGEEFGRERLRQTLHQLKGKNAQEVCDLLKEALLAFRQDASQDDDVTLLAIHVR